MWASSTHASLQWPVRVHLPAVDNYADNQVDKTRLIFRGDGAGFCYSPFRVNSDGEINPRRCCSALESRSPEPLKALTWFPPAETRAADRLCERRECMGDEQPSMNILKNSFGPVVPQPNEPGASRWIRCALPVCVAFTEGTQALGCWMK